MVGCESGAIHPKLLLICCGVFLWSKGIEPWDTALRLKITIAMIPILIRETTRGDKGTEDLLKTCCVSVAPSTIRIFALMDRPRQNIAINKPRSSMMYFVFLRFIDGLAILLLYSPVAFALKAGLCSIDFFNLDGHFSTCYALMMPPGAMYI